MSELDVVLRAARVLLLDFDGPVCGVFSNHPAVDVAERLRNLVSKTSQNFPEEIAHEQDPLEILRWVSAPERRHRLSSVEDTLCAEELRATSSSEPTPFAREVIVSAEAVGLKLAIVSNNSSAAIVRYLESHRLDRYFVEIVGREYLRPELMKPNSHSLLIAARRFGVQPEECVFLGDSLSDIQAGHSASVPVIALANRQRKVAPFTAASPAILITTMEPVAASLLRLAG